MEYRGVITAREYRGHASDAFQELGEHWHEAMLPKHFTPAGTREYDFRPRTRLYMIRKAKYQGHQNPLEWSGGTKRTVLAIRDVRALKSGTKVTVRLPVPPYIHRGGLAEEMTAVSGGDKGQMVDRTDRALTQKINSSTTSSKRRLR